MFFFSTRNLYSILFCGIAASTFGQIQLTNSIFPQAGDILETSVAQQDSIDLGTPSAQAQTWDFSYFRSASQRSETVQAALNPDFRDADIVEPLVAGFGEAYIETTPTSRTRIAAAANLVIANFSAYYSNTHILQVAPLTYPTTFSDPFRVDFAEHIDSIPFLRDIIDTLLANAGLPITINPDSIRLKVTGSRDATVDAFGTCQMPDSSYEVLRQRVYETTEIAIEIGGSAPFLGFIWFDVTTLVASQLPIPIPLNDTTLYYDYLIADAKVPLLRAFRNADDSQTERIELKGYYDPALALEEPRLHKSDIRVYPNPAQAFVTLELRQEHSGLQVSFFDLQGRKLLQEQLPAGQMQKQLSLQELPQGMYFIEFRGLETGALLAPARALILR